LNTPRPEILGKGSQQRSVTEQSSDELSSVTVDHIATEVPVAISYNGISHAVMMASPLNLQDFALGFSLTERIIDTPAQIKAIEINKARLGYTVQLQIDVSLMDRLDQQKRQMSGRSGCGICGISDLAAAIPNLEPLKGSRKPKHSTIATAIESVHCAALFDSSGQLIALREDIGRHNALDKLIGALQSDDSRGIQNDDFLVISSRASHELITKTVIAGIGSIIAISAATTLAIDMAEKLHLNLVGFVRGERQVVYYQN
jgi:FdhD protein